MGKIKVGVFGAARGNVAIHQLYESPDAQLVAICDKYKPLLESCRKEAEALGYDKITYYEDFEEFIQHDMDAVILANYAHEHAKYGVRLLRSGRHIMTECLTMANMAEAVALIEAVEETGKTYSYAENYCYTPVRLEMRRLYREGLIGEVTHAEGEYVHDCSSIWPQITYGQRDHWRNRNSAVFYCTHSIGPILYMTGLRPVSVTAFQCKNMPYMRDLGTGAGIAGMEIVTLENGALLKSLHGNLKSYHRSNYQLSGTLGGLRDLDAEIGVYAEKPGMNCRGEWKSYKPEPLLLEATNSGHGGADYYTTHYFLNSILGDPEAKERSIDVYQAVEMCMPGTLGWRSIVEGNMPIKLPNLRVKEERDAYRNDTFCTYEEAAGDMYVPCDFADPVEIPDEVYAEVKRRWEAGEPG